MCTPTITVFTWVLAVAPPTPTSTPSDATNVSDIEAVTVESGPESVNVIALDRDDEIVAEVVLHSVDGAPRLDALFPDGLYMSVTGDGVTVDGVTIDGATSENADELIERIAEIESVLVETETTSGWTCGLGAVLTAGACAGAAAAPNPWTVGACGGGLYLTFCDCAHTVDPEFECA